MDELAEIRGAIEESLAKIDSLITQLKAERERLKAELEKKIEELQFSRFSINPKELEEFLKEPYVIIPKRKDEFYVICPRWVDFQIGWLESRTRSYNIFVVNRYVQWIAPVPGELKKKLKFPDLPPLKVQDGMLITGEFQDAAWQRYKSHLLRREGDDKIRIKKGHEFELIAQLIEDGILPFVPKPVDKSDLRDWHGIKLRGYQKRAWREFLKRGAIGVYWSFGAGKSIFGLYALARIKGRKLVVVPTLTLKEQWLERINKYIPDLSHEIDIITYHGYNKVKKESYTLTIYDESQFLPANTFIRLATIKTKYRLGFSASPFREDGRENLIIALTGFPVGLQWDELLQMQIVKEPIFRLYLVKNDKEKLKKLDELLKLPLKTIIFCDYIEFGKKIAKTFDIPFVYGKTKKRLETIREAETVVVSRVGDEGLSLPDIERVIEVAFLAGSRMQESQRFGRLMHSMEDEPQHIIIMTREEYEKYQKRLLSIYERGFRIEVIL